MMFKQRLFLFFFYILISTLLFSQEPLISFRKINSGTKSNIRQIEADSDGNVYFLSDDIYQLFGDEWKKLEFPAAGKIFVFFPVSSGNLWFSVNLVTNTSQLYHHHNGITENIPSPFSNHITAICFTSDKSGCLSSYADIAVYENNGFKRLPLAPVRYVIEKLFTPDNRTFWGKTNSGELFSYRKGVFELILKDRRVADFAVSDPDQCFLVAENELVRMDRNGIHTIYHDPLLNSISKMVLLKDGNIFLAGEKGIMAHFRNGRLTRLPRICRDNLTDMTVTSSGEVWVCGDNGSLLYFGKHEFPEYHESKSGFSSRKLILYGISTDDEYGVAMEDFDRDGRMDIYSMRIFEQNRLYMNHLDPQTPVLVSTGFQEEAFKRNATGSMQPGTGNTENELKLGVNAADIDNDGDADLYLCYLNSNNKLLLNNGDGYFRNVSAQTDRASGNLNRCNSSVFADVDLDGDLDLFVTSEEGSNRLFENDGTGHFRDITGSSGLSSQRGGMCASFADVNEDGYPDLAVSFWYFPNRIYLNTTAKGRISFRDFTAFTDLNKAGPGKSNAVAFADVNNDGHIDLFIGNRDRENKLYLNDGKGQFTDKTRDYFDRENYMTNGAVFADFDLDGCQDLYISNVGANVLYKNLDGKYFKDVTAEFGAELSGYCTGSAAGDIDNDGDPDLYVGNYINGDSKLFINITGNRNFVKFHLAGIRSNRDAIGAKVWLFEKENGDKAGKLAGFREITAGGGYGSCSAKEVIFGVKEGTGYYALVKYPSTADTMRIENIRSGTTREISEMKGADAILITYKKGVIRFFTDEETRPEIFKYILIIVLLILYNLRNLAGNRRIGLIRGLGSLAAFLVFILVNHFFLYQWAHFSFFIAPVAFTILLITLHLYIDRILLRNLARREKHELREKISRDLHDDLASTLGSISIYAGTLREEQATTPGPMDKLAGKIEALSEAAVQSISDIIWMTSPRNDSLQSLVSKAQNNMQEMLTDSGIRFLSEIELPDKPVFLSDGMRNDIFLILKEATHNIIRHSGAGNVLFRVLYREKRCTITVKDDGSGLPETTTKSHSFRGHGLINMRKRAEDSGIDLNISSGAGIGTEISLEFVV